MGKKNKGADISHGYVESRAKYGLKCKTKLWETKCIVLENII